MNWMQNLKIVAGIVMLLTAVGGAQADPWAASPDWVSDDAEFTMSVALADLDNDGDLDLIEGNYKYPYSFPPGHPEELGESVGQLDIGAHVNVYEWRDGAFQPPCRITSDLTPRCIDGIAVADYDHDGDLDIAIAAVVGRGKDGGVWVLKNQFDPVSQPPQTIGDLFVDDTASEYSWHDPESFDCHCVRWVDFDCDGDLDLAALEVPGRLHFYENLSGVLSDYGYLFEFCEGTTMEYGDMDRDGDFDVFLNTGGDVRVYKNQLENRITQIYSPYVYWEEIEGIRDAPFCASFGHYGNEEYLALAVGSHIFSQSGELWGNDIYTFNPESGGSLIHTGQSAADDNAQAITDIQWGYLNDNDEMDLVAVSYPVCRKESETLFWDRGLEQIHLDPESSLQWGSFHTSVWNQQGDLSTSLALGDVDDPGALTAIELYNCWDDEQANGIVYLKYFPAYEVESVLFSERPDSLTWTPVALDQWCFNPADGWVSINRDLIETYTGPEYQWTEFWVKVTYLYSRNNDLAVGNDGINVVYFANGSGGIIPPDNPLSLPALPPYTGDDPIVYQQLAALSAPAANLMAPDAIGATCGKTFEPFDIAYELDNNPNVTRYGLMADWSPIELFRGHYFWDWLDSNLDEVFQRGGKSHLCSFTTPWWTKGNSDDNPPKCRTSDERLHTMFVRSLVNRYRPNGLLSQAGSYDWGSWGVEIFQFENEPNYTSGGYGWNQDAIENVAEKMYRQYQMIKTISAREYPADPHKLQVVSPNFCLYPFPENLDLYLCPPMPYLNDLNSTDLDFIDNGQYNADRVLWRFCDYISQQSYCAKTGTNENEFAVYQDPFSPAYANGDSDLRLGPEHIFWSYYTEGLSEYATGTPSDPAWDPVMRLSANPEQYSEHPFFIFEWSFFNDWFGENLGVDSLLPHDDWICAQIAELFSVDVFPKSDSRDHRLVAYTPGWLGGYGGCPDVFNTCAGLLNDDGNSTDTSQFYFEGYFDDMPGIVGEPDVHCYTYTKAQTNERVHFIRTESDLDDPVSTIVTTAWDFELFNAGYLPTDIVELYTPNGAVSQKTVNCAGYIGYVTFAAGEVGSEMLMLEEPAGSPIQIVGPQDIQLHQNYPNPFNPMTTIRFGLPVGSWVRLEVFDISGRRVPLSGSGTTPTTALVDGWRAAGHHEVTFDASGIASGVYLYRLEAGDLTAVKQMVLMK